jgi:hypothetical protein
MYLCVGHALCSLPRRNRIFRYYLDTLRDLDGLIIVYNNLFKVLKHSPFT